MTLDRLKFLSEFDNFYNNLAPDIKERGGLYYKDKINNKGEGKLCQKNKKEFLLKMKNQSF